MPNQPPGAWPWPSRTFNKPEPGTTTIKVSGLKKSPLFTDNKPHVFEDVIVSTEDAPAHAAAVTEWLDAYDRHYGCSGWRYMVNVKDHIAK